MSLPFAFALLGGLLVLAFAANRLFRLIRIPDVVVLMAAGVLLGPVLGWVQPSQFQPAAHALGTLALILILFEGGLDLDLRETLRHFPGGILLSILSYIFTVAVVALVIRWSMGLSRASALLVGSVLGCTSSSVTLPVLQQIEASTAARTTLLLDASLSDTFAVVTVSVLLGLGAEGAPSAAQFAHRLLATLGVSLLFALTAAVVWSLLLPRLSEQRFWHALTFAAVLLLYAATEHAGASGLVAVLSFGIALANSRRIGPALLNTPLGFEAEAREHHSQMLTFHSELAFLVRSFFFVLIGVLVKWGGLVRFLPQVLGIVGATILGRGLAVGASSWSWREFDPRERELVMWIMPRGLITVVLALQVVAARGNEFAFLPEAAFAVILATSGLLVIGSLRARHIASPAPAAAAPDRGSVKPNLPPASVEPPATDSPG